MILFSYKLQCPLPNLITLLCVQPSAKPPVQTALVALVMCHYSGSMADFSRRDMERTANMNTITQKRSLVTPSMPVPTNSALEYLNAFLSAE